MKILVVIDVQNDFITGALRNEEAIKRVPNIVKEINEYKADFIFATKDTHYKNYSETMEGKKLPVPHCIRDTDGWQIEPTVADAIINSNCTFYYTILKETFGYDEWGKVFNHIIKSLYEQDIKQEELEIEIIGYCTDICVISNTLILKATFPNAKIKVKESCCAGVTKESHDIALKAMQACHIDIV